MFRISSRADSRSFFSVPEGHCVFLPGLRIPGIPPLFCSFVLMAPGQFSSPRCNGRDLARSHLSNNMSGAHIESDFWVFRYIGKSSRRWQRADMGFRLLRLPVGQVVLSSLTRTGRYHPRSALTRSIKKPQQKTLYITQAVRGRVASSFTVEQKESRATLPGLDVGPPMRCASFTMLGSKVLRDRRLSLESNRARYFHTNIRTNTVFPSHGWLLDSLRIRQLIL